MSFMPMFLLMNHFVHHLFSYFNCFHNFLNKQAFDLNKITVWLKYKIHCRVRWLIPLKRQALYAKCSYYSNLMNSPVRSLHHVNLSTGTIMLKYKHVTSTKCKWKQLELLSLTRFKCKIKGAVRNITGYED